MVVTKAELNYYPEEVIEEKKLKKQESPKNKKNPKRQGKINPRLKLFGLFLSVFIMAFSLFILLGYANISKVSFEINQLENKRNQLESEKAALVADLEGIKSYRRIADEAMHKLGMIYPKEDQVVYVSFGNDLDTNSQTEENKGFLKSVSEVFGIFSSLF